MKLLILFMTIFLGAYPAMAQQCDIAPAGIVKLRAPKIGAFNLWDRLYGVPEFDEGFVDGFSRRNGHVIAVGGREIGGDTVNETRLIMAEFDQRGRKVWEAEHAVKSLQHVVKAFPHQDGFVVLAAQKGAAWVGVFDLDGALKSQRRIALPKMNIVPRDLIVAPRGKGFVMAASAKGADNAFYSMFIRLNTKFQFVTKRGYKTGLENEILALMPFGHGIVASGYMKDDRGRDTGWLLRLENDGAIGWQKQFPRGAGARLRGISPYGEERIFVYGEALPSSGDNQQAGWVLLADAGSGDIAWQRYYTSQKYAYAARDVLVNDDGLISVLLDGEMPDGMRLSADVIKDQAGRALGNRSDYVRLLTLNPRGVIFDSMHFFYGEGADAFALVKGEKQERILIGASDMHYEDAAKTVDSREGWIVAAPALDPYTDPCQ